MFTYQRTKTVNGRYAFRASNGSWHIIDERMGGYTGHTLDTKDEALEFLHNAAYAADGTDEPPMGQVNPR